MLLPQSRYFKSNLKGLAAGVYVVCYLHAPTTHSNLITHGGDSCEEDNRPASTNGSSRKAWRNMTKSSKLWPDLQTPQVSSQSRNMECYTEQRYHTHTHTRRPQQSTVFFQVKAELLEVSCPNQSSSDGVKGKWQHIFQVDSMLLSSVWALLTHSTNHSGLHWFT